MGRTNILDKKIYIPDEGDLIWINFDPAIGREQKGLRPALVLSSKDINRYSDLVIVCPITSVFKNNVLNVNVNTKKIKGQILSNQVKTLDWRKRRHSFAEKIDQQTLDDVKAKLAVILNI